MVSDISSGSLCGIHNHTYIVTFTVPGIYSDIFFGIHSAILTNSDILLVIFSLACVRVQASSEGRKEGRKEEVAPLLKCMAGGKRLLISLVQ